MRASGSLGDLSGLNATGAHAHPSRAALRQGHANRLQIWIELARGAVVCVRYVIAELGRLSADFTTFSHYFFENLQMNAVTITVSLGLIVQIIDRILNQNL